MLGIDVSKDTLDAALADCATRARRWEIKVGNNAAGVQALLDRTDPSVEWVVEPTGRYSSLVVKQAAEAGRVVRLAPNRAAKLFLKSANPRAKTDRLDSFGLALFGLSRPLCAFKPKEEAVEHLDQLLSARRGLSGSLQRLKLQRAELAYAREALDPAIQALAKQIKAVDGSIEDLTKSNPDFKLAEALLTVPGVGRVTAASIASRLRGRDFASPDAFTAYIGLDVAVRQSGKSAGRAKLTKQGDSELRRLLYMAALANLRCRESVFKDRYRQLKAGGRSSTASLNIVARKIAHVCWALKRHGGEFDPSKVYRKPEPPPA